MARLSIIYRDKFNLVQGHEFGVPREDQTSENKPVHDEFAYNS